MDNLKNYYLEYLNRNQIIKADKLFDFTSDELNQFLKRYVPDFKSVFECFDINFYLKIQIKIATNKTMQEADKKNGGMYSNALKYYIGFLQSKYFPRPETPFEGKNKKSKKEKAKTKIVSETGLELELPEGSKKHIEQERSWRNPKLRRACIAHYGYVCQCCGFDFSKAYGEDLGKAFIEVHHLKPISSFDDEHLVNPIKDLVPLCSNCHAMIHRGKEGPLTLRELREKYKGIKWEIPVKMED